MDNVTSKKYTYRLSDGITETVVYPVLGGNPLFDEKRDDRLRFTETFQGTFTFTQDDYQLIKEADFNAFFTLSVDLTNEDATVTTDWKKFTFRRFKVSFDDDILEASITPEIDTINKVIQEALEKEFDLIQLAPGDVSVSFTKRPIIQIYFLGSDFLLNYQAGNWWETPVNNLPATNTDMENMRFERLEDPFYYIPETSPMIPNVAGKYIYQGAGNPVYIREDNHYELDPSGPTGTVWSQIYDLLDSNRLVYDAGSGNNIRSIDPPFATAHGSILQSQDDPASQLRGFLVHPWFRILTDKDTYLTNPTLDLQDQEDDFNFFGNFGFKKAVDLSLVSFTNPLIIPFDGHSPDPTPYGKYADDTLSWVNEYFTKPSYAGRILPVGQTDWLSCSYWIGFDATIEQIFIDAAVTFTLKRCHLLPQVIKVLLAEIAPGVTHEATTDYSQFLYSPLNPISGDAKKDILITQKSNLKSGEFEKPATRALIKLGPLLDMLWNTQRLTWWVDDQNRFRLEHWDYIVKGGTYTGSNISADVTTLKDSTNGEPIETGQKKLEPLGNLEYRSILCKWMDRVSFAFEGYPIEDNNLNDLDTITPIEDSSSLFTSDVDYVLANPDEVANDGFIVMGCDPVIAGRTYNLPVEGITVNTNENYELQNRYFSPFYFHRWFIAFGWLSATIKRNNNIVTPRSRALVRQQNLATPDYPGYDKNQLVTTSYGNGFIQEVQTEFYTSYKDLKLLHEPD